MLSRHLPRFVLASLFLCATAFGAEPLRLRVATYNLGNYTLADRMVDGVYRLGYPKPEREKQALRRVIAAVDADILAIQEIGPLPFLEELRRDLETCGAKYPHLAVVNAEDQERHVALLSRIPPKRIVRHESIELRGAEEKARVKRGLLEVVFDTPAGEFTLWIVHLKSRITDRPSDPGSSQRRAAEAVAIRDLILKRFPNPERALFLVAGDFNDTRQNRPIRAFLDRGDTNITRLLPMADSRSERWTHHNIKDDAYERVDHFLASPGLLACTQPSDARIADLPETALASDHRPAWIDLSFPSAPLPR